MTERVKLISRVETKTRFSEVDSMGVVWHGNYVKYLEDGRESFGDEFQFGYFDVYKFGLTTPIVKLNMNYKHMIKYGEKVIIETEYVPTEAAKIIFNYRIINAATNILALAANSTQVFLNTQGELQLTNPEFYLEWKKKWNLIK
ncbi:MAG: acyl-CoA thioesterase [Bacteroidetes bacterium]|jgi:acyl-CoA thioester hydrolase|nr:acyl-CoA thioesterase [Bacteroidota bacterium]MBT6686349.1 acyl-CoA thioesterase [Bacteroidota bacterium]MBT7142182.1 acyl-CoA thioesterase [Bacteroidota bacterium]MBT7490463.1 acyl-CoA thioesterase [Bacteroidota bacterium]